MTIFLVPKFVRPPQTLEEAFSKGTVLHAPLEENDIAIKHLYNIGDSPCTYADIEFGVETQLGALAYILGKENEGMKAIRQFIHFNNAQVGWNAIACSLSAYYHSLSFAHDPRPLDSLANMPTAYHKEITKEVPKIPDDGNTYVSFKSYVPTVELAKEFELELYHDDQQLISDGRQIKRPLLSQPSIKLLLLSQKAYAEGGLALCVYLTHLNDLLENDQKRHPNDTELQYLTELLSPIVKCYSSKYSMIGIQNARQIFDGVGVVDANITNELSK